MAPHALIMKGLCRVDFRPGIMTRGTQNIRVAFKKIRVIQNIFSIFHIMMAVQTVKVIHVKLMVKQHGAAIFPPAELQHCIIRIHA
jgi:hypothetical protein